MTAPGTAPTAVSEVMAAALADQRDRCNALVVQARRARPGFSTGQLAELIAGPLGALVDVCERELSGSGARVLRAVFPVVVDLVGQRRADDPAQRAAMAAWPRLSVAIVDDPRRVVASLANAVVHLQAHRLDAVAWVGRVVEAAPGHDAATTLRAGQVAAWRGGLAHARDGVLRDEVAGSLPASVLGTVLGLRGEGSPAEALARLRADRWWHPTAAAPSHRVGGFRGFGGPFLSPPQVAVVDGVFLVGTDEGTWVLHADAFGATLTRLGRSGQDRPTQSGSRPPTVAPERTAGSARDGQSVASTSLASYSVLVRAVP